VDGERDWEHFAMGTSVCCPHRGMAFMTKEMKYYFAVYLQYKIQMCDTYVQISCFD